MAKLVLAFMNGKLLVLAVAITGLFLLAGCSLTAPVTITTVNAYLGSPFQLGIGQTALISTENLTVKLLNLSDSRCPSGVQCIWAGEVSATVRIAKDGRELATLNLTAGVVPKFTNGYAVTLNSVEPYPKSTQRILPSQYAATFTITKEPFRSLSMAQQAKVSNSLAFLVDIKNSGGVSPDSEASKILSKDSATITIEFRSELNQQAIQSLENSDIQFEMVNGEVSHTGRFYNADVAWNSMWKALNTLTSMPDVVKVDTPWKPASSSFS